MLTGRAAFAAAQVTPLNRTTGFAVAVVRAAPRWRRSGPAGRRLSSTGNHLEGVESYEEMQHFHIMNTPHKGVRMDMADRHLLTIWELEGAAILVKEEERSYLQARAAKLCGLLLNTSDSPWLRKVKVAGHDGLTNQLIGHHTMVPSLEPTLKDASIERLGDDALSRGPFRPSGLTAQPTSLDL